MSNKITADELDMATSLAYDLDSFFRAHDKSYPKTFTDIEEKQTNLCDGLLTGDTAEIKRLLDDLGQDDNDTLNIELVDYEREFDKPGKYYVHTKAAVNSNYKDMVAFVGTDEKIYMGKSKNYLFHTEGIPYYDNKDNSFTFISDNKEIFYFLYGEGWTVSQQEMIDNGTFTENDYEEFNSLQNGILTKLEKTRDIAFDGKPFNYLETAEKTEQQNFNQIDGQINNTENEKNDTMENVDEITILVVKPMKAPFVKDIEPDLKSLQAEVGGNIEAYYPFDNEVGIICNDEGKINSLPLNRAVYDDDKNMIEIMAGTFLICGFDNENGTFSSLDEDMIKKYSDIFKYPEQFFKRDNEIIALPVRPSIRKQLNENKELGDISVPKPPHKSPPEL